MNNEKILSNDELLKVAGGAKFVLPILPKVSREDKIIWFPRFPHDFGVDENVHPLLTPDYGVVPIYPAYDR